MGPPRYHGAASGGQPTARRRSPLGATGSLRLDPRFTLLAHSRARHPPRRTHADPAEPEPRDLPQSLSRSRLRHPARMPRIHRSLSDDRPAGLRHHHRDLCAGPALRRAQVLEALPLVLSRPGALLRAGDESDLGGSGASASAAPHDGDRQVQRPGRHRYDRGRAPRGPAAQRAPTRVTRPRKRDRRGHPGASRPARPSAGARTGWLRHERAWVASLLGLHLVLALWGALRNSVTFDENFHLPSGVLIAARGDFRISPFNPPLVKTLFALPALAAGARLPDPAAVDTQDQWVAGESFMRRNADRYHRVFFAARCVVALISLATGFLVWKYARRLQGRAAGLLALAFYVTAAESLAHAGVATMDVATGFGMLAAVYAFWGFCRSGRWTWWLKAVLALGFCALTRFNTAILGPILLLLAVLGTALSRIRRPARVWLGLLLAVPATLVILDLGYLAHVSFRPLSAWQFASPSFQHLQQRVPWLRLPLPDAYLFGLDIQAREGAGGTPTYLLHP